MKKFHRTDFILWLLPVYILVAYWRVFLVILAFLAGMAAACGQTYSGQVIYGQIPAGSNVTANDCTIVNYSGWCFESLIPGANISFRNCYFVGRGVKTYRAGSLSIENCHFEAHGKVAILVQDVGPSSAAIQIVNTDIVDAITGIALQYVQDDPNVWLFNDRLTQTTRYAHNDQVSIYESSGTPNSLIGINHLLLVCNPDARQTLFSGGIIVDVGSYYVAVVNNTVLNGQSNSGIASYANGTSLFTANAIVGIGAPTGWSVGFSVGPGAGRSYNNTIGWWDSYDHSLHNLFVQLNEPNYLLTQDQITLVYEQRLVSQWERQAGLVGYKHSPNIQFPKASEFP